MILITCTFWRGFTFVYGDTWLVTGMGFFFILFKSSFSWVYLRIIIIIVCYHVPFQVFLRLELSNP
ncbi:hypothetical protein F4775DRAFT_537904 [Biscogniauxia sp. FL1348]|nr:hypothetical protein F4775DRAFT_537904 [Biscogniauxia sp. FL1348]